MDNALWLVLLPLLLVLGYFIATFNRLIARRNACTNARSSIDVNLTRRHELIPNLVECVRGYTAHEQQTLQDVTRARENAMAQLGAPGSASAEQQVEKSLARLVMRAEDYPDLKADSLFSQLMRNLTEAEEQISASRRAFNGQVMRLNNVVEQFPTSIVANMTGFHTLDSYSAAAAAQTAPAVDLAHQAGRDG